MATLFSSTLILLFRPIFLISFIISQKISYKSSSFLFSTITLTGATKLISFTIFENSGDKLKFDNFVSFDDKQSIILFLNLFKISLEKFNSDISSILLWNKSRLFMII